MGMSAAKEPLALEVYRHEPVLIFMPIGRDAELTGAALKAAGIESCLCSGAAELCVRLESGAAAIVLTSEAIAGDRLTCISEMIDRQPAWSDIPVILLAAPNDGDLADQVLGRLNNVTLLERPIRIPTLVSVINAGMRARIRQHEVRSLLENAAAATKEAERQQAYIEMLNQRLRRAMTETHHRVKNNLQIILAMIDMQVIENPEKVDTENVQRLGMHVRILVTIHDLLTRQAKADGEAHYMSSTDLLEQLLPLIQQLSTNRVIESELEDAWLSARQGTSLALVVNELVSNAVKNSTSRVRVKVKSEPQCAVIKISDDGPGFPPDFSPEKSARTGLELVENLIRWDLQGVTEYGTHDGGGCVTVTVPLNVAI